MFETAHTPCQGDVKKPFGKKGLETLEPVLMRASYMYQYLLTGIFQSYRYMYIYIYIIIRIIYIYIFDINTYSLKSTRRGVIFETRFNEGRCHFLNHMYRCEVLNARNDDQTEVEEVRNNVICTDC